MQIFSVEKKTIHRDDLAIFSRSYVMIKAIHVTVDPRLVPSDILPHICMVILSAYNNIIKYTIFYHQIFRDLL